MWMINNCWYPYVLEGLGLIGFKTRLLQSYLGNGVPKFQQILQKTCLYRQKLTAVPWG